MPPFLLPGMPEGAIRINPVVSRLSKDGQVTWFLGADNYFSHPSDNSDGHRLALATLMTSRRAHRHRPVHQIPTQPHRCQSRHWHRHRLHLRRRHSVGTLTIRIHRMASPVHDRAITLLLTDLTAAEFRHPETGHRFIYQLL